MGRRYTGKKCVSRIQVPQKNGDIYVYERTTRYDPELKKTVVEGKKLIGKIVAGSDEIVPTRPKKPSKRKQCVDNHSPTEAMNPTAAVAVQPVGAVEILGWAGEESGITEALKKSFPMGDAQKINTIAGYWICTGGQSLSRMERWQLMHSTPYAEGVSENVCERLLVDLSQNEEGIQGYFKEMAKAVGDRPILALALDASTIDIHSRIQHEAGFEVGQEGDALSSVRVLTFMDGGGQHAFAFDQQSGYTSNVISIKESINRVRCLTEGRQKPLIVMDNGFGCEEDLLPFVRGDMPFLTRISTEIVWVQEQLDEIRGRILDIENACPFDPDIYGLTVQVKHNAGDAQPPLRTLYLHFFYCDTKAAQARQAFNEELKALRELVRRKAELSASAQRKVNKYFNLNGKGEVEYNNAAISEERLRFGFLALISNSEKHAFTALKYYRWRGQIEDLFSLRKNSADGCPPAWYSDTLRGRLFVQFVALEHCLFLQTKIDAMMETLGVEEPGKTKAEAAAELSLKSWLEQRSLTQILEWFDAVARVTVMTPYGRRLITVESTVRDQLFLKKLGVIK